MNKFWIIFLFFMIALSASSIVAANEGSNEINDIENIQYSRIDYSELNSNSDLAISDYSTSYSGIISNGDSNKITVTTTESYNSSSKTWDEEGHILSGATVQIFDSSNALIFSGLTNNNGQFIADNLNNGDYTVKISYSTYEEYSSVVKFTNPGSSVSINYFFVPDIVLLMYYSGHTEKINTLLSLSKRVAIIDTYPVYQKELEWLLSYANFVHIDMYTDGGAYSFTTDVLKGTPANNNYNVAYTFGTFDDTTAHGMGVNFVGGSPIYNTPNTIENTYIGSYFQAESLAADDIMETNMANYLAYINYLISPNKYSNPTLDSSKTPFLASSLGIYHPDYGTLSFSPSQELINQWINNNPGYNSDGYGSLNWMTNEYSDWVKINSDPTDLITTFEKWYSENKPYDNSFVVIVSYFAGGNLVDALIKGYESEGRASFNLFQSTTDPSMASLLVAMNNASTRGFVSANSLYSWSLDYGNLNNSGAIDDLTELDLTILKAVDQISQTSYESELGPQLEWTYAVTIPSFEGIFGAIVVSYVDASSYEHVIQSGVDKLVKMTLEWVNLKEKENQDKKVTIVLYNYPPGKAEIGASYLDVFQSVSDLLEQLYYAGYNIGMEVEDIPDADELYLIVSDFGNKGTWAKGLLNQYVEDNFETLLANGQLVNLDKFHEFLDSFPVEMSKQLIDYWGSGLGEIMVYKDTYIVIPGIFYGNIFITFQPSRGWEEVDNYHDLTLPPHQQYVTFYKWLDEVWQTDAIINMGTHGTLEFLPGSSIGVQEDDWTFQLTLNPTIYPYIVSNPGEGMVAKERLGSLIITHMTPAIVASELYSNYTQLKEYIANYENAIKTGANDLAESYQELIIEYAKLLAFEEKSENQDFNEWADALHIYLESMEYDFNAFGMHSLGNVITGEELIQEVITIVSSKTNIYNYLIEFLFADLAHLDYSDDLRKSTLYVGEVAEIQSWLYKFVFELVDDNISCYDLAIKYDVSIDSDLYECLLYCVQTIIDIQNNMEWESLLKALSGSYVQAGIFNDPSYGDSLPTGVNGYATDSSKMPSQAAYISAVKLVDIIIVDYYETNGQWPELMGLILWGTEILRTEGIGIAEFLYFLGFKPTWSSTGVVIGVEMIPIEDLTVKLSNGTIVNRPRIDVFASMVTSNSNWIKLMVTAVNMAYYNTPGEDETVNYVKKHYAENPSLDRLFGLPGAILEGTGMSDYIPNTNKWQNSTNLGTVLNEIYLNRVSYSWNLDEKGNIVITQKKDDYSYLLANVDVITQNIDSTWRFLDSDDYYDWFGGMYAAANYLGGNPTTAIMDIRNQNNYQMRTLAEELEFEIRSNVLNPLYRDALLSTTAGWLEYSAKFENLFGFETLITSSTGNSMLSTGVYNMLGQNLMDISSQITASNAAAWVSMASWMVYAFEKGYWDADIEMIQDLADSIILTSIPYGVACCHHTCANLDFNKLLVQVSTLSDAKKQEYSDVLQAATLSEAVYTSSENIDNPQTPNKEKPKDTSAINENGTSSEDTSSSSGASTSVGQNPSQSNPTTASSSSNGQTSTSGENQEQDSSDVSSDSGDAYEVTKSNTKKSASNEASMPISIIVSIIALISLFGFGYIRK